MKQVNAGLAVSLMTLSLLSGASFAQGGVDLGKSEYMASCASCHGVSGKGDGAMRSYLTKPPSDLTLLAKLNGGVFPGERIGASIDGRTGVMIGSHGAREMPVWGQIYRGEDTQPPDLNARNRITALLDYLSKIQEK